ALDPQRVALAADLDLVRGGRADDLEHAADHAGAGDVRLDGAGDGVLAVRERDLDREHAAGRVRVAARERAVSAGLADRRGRRLAVAPVDHRTVDVLDPEV